MTGPRSGFPSGGGRKIDLRGEGEEGSEMVGERGVYAYGGGSLDWELERGEDIWRSGREVSCSWRTPIAESAEE